MSREDFLTKRLAERGEEVERLRAWAEDEQQKREAVEEDRLRLRSLLATDDAFDLFKNERDYCKQASGLRTQAAAMNWAVSEIERLRVLLKRVADGYEGTNYYEPELLAEARAAISSQQFKRRKMNREHVAYNIFRGGFRADAKPPPHWDDLEPWIRDAITVAYLQGKHDGSTRTAHQQLEEKK